MAALNRSEELAKGWRGRIFGVVLLIALMNGVLNLLISQLEHVLPSVTVVRNAAGLPQAQFHFINSLIRVLAEQLVTILFATYSAVCTTLIYFDLRARKEGYDLELAAQGEASPDKGM